MHADSRPTRSFPPLPGRVLVVDDDALAREITAAMVENAGHRVMTAKNVVEALAIANKESPEIILTAVQMQQMDGWQLVRIIRSRPNLARIPIVFLTELDSEEERLRGYRYGVDDYLEKSMPAAELHQRLQRVLMRSRAQAQEESKNALRGELSHVALTSLLGFLEMERRSGVLCIEQGSRRAILHLKQGTVVNVELAPERTSIKGIDRLFHVLDWERGRFELTNDPVKEADSIGAPTSFVLLEYARLKDAKAHKDE